MSSIILGTSLLTARGIPVAGEYEVKNVLAMKIMDGLGAGGSFTEFYAWTFDDDVVLMGHDGPGHLASPRARRRCGRWGLSRQGRPRIFGGDVGATWAGDAAFGGRRTAQFGFKLVVAEGGCEAGPILEIGNTNSRYRFPVGARWFIEEWNAHGPAHHCAIGVGACRSTCKTCQPARNSDASGLLKHWDLRFIRGIELLWGYFRFGARSFRRS